MILEYNLQFFAKDGPGGEKTENATDKKLKDSRKDGQVAKSKEIGNGLGLLSLFIILKIWIGNMGTSLISMFEFTYSRIPEYVNLTGGVVSKESFAGLLNEGIKRIMIIVLPIFIIGVIVAFLGDLVQVKWKPTSKPLQPKFSKLNPLKGFKKILSKDSIVELIKAFFKILIVVYVVYTTLKKSYNDLFSFYDMPLMQGIALVGKITINLGLKIAIIYMILAMADFAYQKIKFKNDMKMTKQEIRDEYKNAEGDPLIKGKIRQRMREVSQRRMMQDLPKADVVITNPTHFAVAIQYDVNVSEAPIVLAKGGDYLARKIKETAKEHNIQIVENKPLARMLYHNVEVGGQVPPELYQAVAEVLAMVYHMQGKA
ncbi:MAG TPA: flagellar biosynthesis protein FlhB [Lachnospiraceae bacterium]|nr:flagellar biosynthesis protein FlhB [Lachnospiraceae bacterium]